MADIPDFSVVYADADMTELIDEYLGEIPEKMTAIEEARVKVFGGATDEAALVIIRRLAHGFKGSGATYGFPAITEAGKHAETCPLSELPEALDTLLDLLRRTLAAHAEWKKNS